MDRLVISLCDRSTVAVKTWAEHGYECWCVDTENPPGLGPVRDGIRLVGMDVRDFCPPTNRIISFAYAFPPCDHLAVSGSRWFKGKGLRKLAEAIDIVGACAEICERSGAPYVIENPISTLSTYWRKPDYTFSPHQYAGYLDCPDHNAYTKRTCLWVGNGFIMPEKYAVEPIYGSIMHTLPDSKGRKERRSITPQGFAIATFFANHKG